MRFVFIVLLSACSSSTHLLEKVTVQTQSGRTIAFQVELARTGAEREQGLMYRKRLSADHGMLFVFPAETQAPFWMKNTPLPLDMIFLNREGVVVDLIENAVPFSEALLTPKASYDYVLEVRGGTVTREGIRIGDSVQLPVRGLQVPGRQGSVQRLSPRPVSRPLPSSPRYIQPCISFSDQPEISSAHPTAI